MSGIYIHIPFCKQACYYCNFHFSTSLKYKNELIDALLQEISMQADYLKGQKVQTIYFGGGTPSLLSADEVKRIFEQLNQYFDIASDFEMTLEANPDDLTANKIKAFRKTPINRFSIGIQSFIDKDLQFMNRSHDSKQAENCIRLAQDANFNNLTIDLIYGTPTMNDAAWQSNLDKAISFNIPHISAYCLTVEPKTALDYFVKKGKAPAVDEEQAAHQFEILIETLAKNDFLHYEISNFCRKGQESRHNSSYWKGQSYLGLGPSAHTFNGHSRQWNIANNAQYIQRIQAGQSAVAEVEQLTDNQRFNEYLMTSLRTIWGCDLVKIEEDFGLDFLTFLNKNSQKFKANDLLIEENKHLFLTSKGKFLSDGIISDLMQVD